MTTDTKSTSDERCTATVDCTNGVVTTKSCKTGRPLIDTGGNYEGDRDDYMCPDCGHTFSVYYED